MLWRSNGPGHAAAISGLLTALHYGVPGARPVSGARYPRLSPDWHSWQRSLSLPWGGGAKLCSVALEQLGTRGTDVGGHRTRHAHSCSGLS